MARYIVIDYNEGKSETPRIDLRTNDLKVGEERVDELAKKHIDRCVNFFDIDKNEILRIIMLSEPIYFVRAVELARSEWKKSRYFKEGTILKIKGGTAAVLSEIVKRLSGVALPGVGAAILGHILAPYYAVKGDSANAAGAAAGMYGGLSGAIIGFAAGGPVGALIGGAIGGTGLGAGATALVRANSHPSQCSKCKGVGLDADLKRCTRCDGHGYTE